MIAPTTKEDIKRAMLVTMAVAETIREAGEVPSGTIYAAIMSKVSLECYQAILRTLENAELIKVHPSHLIRWIGPLKGATK